MQSSSTDLCDNNGKENYALSLHIFSVFFCGLLHVEVFPPPAIICISTALLYIVHHPTCHRSQVQVLAAS